MADEQQPTLPPWQAIPKDMIVQAVPTIWATNVNENGSVWLWLRTPNSCTSTEFSPDVARHLARALVEGAAAGEALRNGPEATLEVVQAPLLGPDGRPVR